MSEEDTFKIRLNGEDRPFLDDECLRLMQETFERTRELRRPSYADVISALLAELRQHRRELLECSCGARATADRVRLR